MAPRSTLALGVLIAAWRTYPRPADLEPIGVEWPHNGRAFPRIFWVYLVTASLVAAGYADVAPIAYHFDHRQLVPTDWIPILYTIAMGVQALTALAFGRLFDRFGISVLIASIVLSAPFAPLVFLGHVPAAVAGMALWGAGIGAQDTILRAVIATMIPPERRASAYGLFNAGFGLAWFLGSALMGYLYDVSTMGLVTFSVLAHIAAVPLPLGIGRRTGVGRRKSGSRVVSGH